MIDLWILFSTIALLCVYGAYQLLSFVIRPYFSSLRDIPGPPNPSFFSGNSREISDAPVCEAQERWIAEYGDTICWKADLNEDRLMTLDINANARVLSRLDIYQRSKVVQRFISYILGEGLAGVEGEVHKKQRRVLSPAFGQAQVNQLSGVFLSKANELRDKLDDLIGSKAGDSQTETCRLDMLVWLTKATLDVIGAAGFSYNFNAINAKNDEPNELYAAFESLSLSLQSISLWTILNMFVAPLRRIPSKHQRELSHAKGVMDRISLRLVQEKKKLVIESTSTGGIEKASIQDRDLLSLLVRANMATDLPDSQRLSDEEVLSQIPTFLIAGHDTTSTTLAWALHSLSLHPDVQNSLRKELQGLSLPTGYSEDPIEGRALEALNSLPLLDAVVRETLRLYPAIPHITRTAIQDDVIHLEKPFKDRHGVLRNVIKIQKGDTIFVPIAVLQRLPSLWGPDAKEFNPDRWLDKHSLASNANLPGVYSRMLSFSGGQHACIGWRFSVLETKIFLHVLLTAFEFAPAAKGISQRPSASVVRPVVSSEASKGGQLPLHVSCVQGDAE